MTRPDRTAAERAAGAVSPTAAASSSNGEAAAAPAGRFQIVDLAALPPVDCPCGEARRAFADVPHSPGTIHLTDIREDARTHYHREHTETYYFLECDAGAQMELDGQRFDVRPGMCVLIPPGVRHRAVGRMRILNIVVPKFDPADEHFD